MYQNDYIVAFDEKGKPYIAHSAVGNAVNRVASAVKNARGDRQNHKYILKIDENGRKRYFYTQDEVKAYYEEKKKQAAGVVDKAKEGIKNVASNAKNAVREATGQAARDRMDVAAKNRDTWANARSDANDRLQKASEEKYAARQEKEQAQKEAREADNAIKGLRDKVHTDGRRLLEDLNKEMAADIRQTRATYDAYRANSANKTNEAVNSQRVAEQAKAEAAQARSDRERVDKSFDLSVRAYDTQMAKSRDAHRKADNASRREQEADEAFTKANSDRKAARDLQYEAEAAYKENKAAYDKSLAGAVDRTAARARDVASDAKEAASSAYNKAKDSANNTITNAKNRFERMKSEFRDKADKAGDTAKATTQSAADRLKDVSGINARKNVQTTQKALDDAKTAENRAENRWWTNAKEAMAHPSDKTEARERQSMENMSNKTHERYLAEDAARDARIAYRKTPLAKAEDVLNNVKNTVKDIAGYDEREHRNNAQKRVDEARESGNTPTTMDNTRAAQAQKAYNKTPLGMIENARNAISSAKDAAEKAGTAVKDKAEDLSAKAKSTTQAAKESAQGMIENARSSTAKAVNEAWDKIPKNADGTVNPFDSNFQSAYNDWKSKKDKYDGSLTGQAKAAAEKATDSVKDMIDKAKKTAKDASQQISDNLDVKQLQKNLERDMKNHGYSLEDAYNQHKDWLKTMQSGQLPEDHKEYYKKMSELEDQAYKELKAKNATKSSYTKKPDPVNSSGARPYETMKRDAREAGVDFAAYDKAASDAEKLAKRLMKEYREANETSGPKSLVGKMWYDDPEYKRAVERRKAEEEKLVKQLYQ